MTPGMTQDPELAEMVAAAQLAQLPPRVRALWPFPQVMGPGEPFCETPTVPDVGDVTSGVPCRCGCGRPVRRAQTGRSGLYASGACRMRALRERRRLAAGS